MDRKKPVLRYILMALLVIALAVLSGCSAQQKVSDVGPNAVEHLGSPLIVVMGHEKCGAVKATVEGGEAPGSIGSIVAKIKPAVDKAKAAGTAADQLAEKSADENVKLVKAKVEKSPIVKYLMESGKVSVVGGIADPVLFLFT
jgi:carbonic anhydrase